MDLLTWRDRVSTWLYRRRLATTPLANERSVRQSQPHRTAFVLLGGGARGAAQAGALSVILEHGIVPDYIVGISAGSWNGAYLAQEPTPGRAHDLENLWLQTSTLDIVGPRRWRAAFNALALRSSLYGNAGVRRVAERYLGDITFEDLRVPLRVVATDLGTGNAHFFAEGRVLPAVVASSAMPGVFPPVVTQDSVFIDGGVAEWAACLDALGWGATRICFLACGAARRESRARTVRRVLERSLEISLRNNFDAMTFALRASGIDVLAVFPDLPRGTMLDFDLAPAFIEAGRAAARQALGAWEHEAMATPIEGDVDVQEGMDSASA
ncbi:MAG: patatin-like phospholipase family protein [Nitrososphaerota archaeon]